jgi:hypothetical protein
MIESFLILFYSAALHKTLEITSRAVASIQFSYRRITQPPANNSATEFKLVIEPARMTPLGRLEVIN